MSYAEIAKRVGMSPSNFSRWESGEYAPSFDAVRKICDALSIPILPALVNAGLLSQREVSGIIPKVDTAELQNDDLIFELQRRLDRTHAA